MNQEPNSTYKSTPPTTRKIRNPFEKALVDRLHKPICSPSMYQILKKPKNGMFHWDIDQACVLAPRDIEACTSQFETSPDPALEKMAEEVSEQFFSQEMVMPSPVIPSPSSMLQTLESSTSCTITRSIVNQDTCMSYVSSSTAITDVLPIHTSLPDEEEHDIYEDYEITANGSLRRKLTFEEHVDVHYDSEQTDDESQVDMPPPSPREHHEPVVFSPDLNQDLVSKGQERTFSTPLKQGAEEGNNKGYRNKILELHESCFTPTQFRRSTRAGSETPSSLASASISPVVVGDEKNQFTSPESDGAPDSIVANTCKPTVTSGLRSELVLSPIRSKKCSSSDKPVGLTRSRSVQKLDFSMDMSIDGTLPHADTERDVSPESVEVSNTWSLVEETNRRQFALETFQPIAAKTTPPYCANEILDDTPVKGKSINSILTHEISKIRTTNIMSPMNMSLDTSIDSHNLSLEHKNIDFNAIDLKILTESTQIEHSNSTKVGCSSSSSLRKVDSGFNEYTFYTNASSYYASAIKPSELTITNTKSSEVGNGALKEISNVNWMRTDSGFKDESSADNVQFYQNNEKSAKKFRYSEYKPEDKENITEFESFFRQSKNEAMSMSDIFTEEMTFNCNFSSTPSKCKTRKLNP